MDYPCKRCPRNDLNGCNKSGLPGCYKWSVWFLDAWADARLGVLAKATGYKKAANSAANTANGKEKTTTHIIAEEG